MSEEEKGIRDIEMRLTKDALLILGNEALSALEVSEEQAEDQPEAYQQDLERYNRLVTAEDVRNRAGRVRQPTFFSEDELSEYYDLMDNRREVLLHYASDEEDPEELEHYRRLIEATSKLKKNMGRILRERGKRQSFEVMIESLPEAKLPRKRSIESLARKVALQPAPRFTRGICRVCGRPARTEYGTYCGYHSRKSGKIGKK